MFYLSRAEQAVLALLAALLLAGSGLLIYQQGVEAGRASKDEPLFSEAPAAKRPPDLAAPATQPEAAPVEAAPGESAAGSPAVEKLPRTRRTARTAAKVAPKEKLSLNSATAAQLDALPGIGPVYAQRIIEYRTRKRQKEGRGFESVDELLNIAGIGPKRLSALRDYVVP